MFFISQHFLFLFFKFNLEGLKIKVFVFFCVNHAINVQCLRSSNLIHSKEGKFYNVIKMKYNSIKLQIYVIPCSPS